MEETRPASLIGVSLSAIDSSEKSSRGLLLIASCNSGSSHQIRSVKSSESTFRSFTNSFRKQSFRGSNSSHFSAQSILEEDSSTPDNTRVVPGSKLRRKSCKKYQVDIIDQRKNVTSSQSSDSPIERRQGSLLAVIEETTIFTSDTIAKVNDASIGPKSHVFDMNKLPLTNPNFQTELIIDQFIDVKHLTDGSNSNIYKAHIEQTGQVIILKVIKDSKKSNLIAITEFARESVIISKLNHPHILSIYGTGYIKAKTNNSIHRTLLALEPLDGGSLSFHLKIPRRYNSFPFTVPRYMRIAKEFADALYYLHEKFHSECTIIHRDLKPDNIGFTADGTLKLMDFGLCISVKKNSTDDGLYELTGETGSRRYMPPEVGLRQRYNEKVDMYAYGIILYEIMTGTTPFSTIKSIEDFDREVFRNHQRPPMDYDIFGHIITLAPCVKAFIEKCWDKDSIKRPTANEAYELFVIQENEANMKLKERNCLTVCFTRKDTI